MNHQRAHIFNRQSLLLVALFAIFIIFSLLQGEETPAKLYDLESPAPSGLRGLRLWLEEMGYRIETTGEISFTLAGNEAAAAELLFIYPNSFTYREKEATALRDWVEAGRTLVIIGPNRQDTVLGDTFGIYANNDANFFARETQVQPLLPDARIDRAMIGLSSLNVENAPSAIPALVSSGDGSIGAPTMTVQRVGDGTVWHLSTQHNFTNANLREADEAALLPPLLRTVPPGATILFDTYHLYGPNSATAEQQITSVQDWLYRTYPGWAVLFTLVALFGFRLLQGRRLGPALPSIAEARRREAAEYVEAMASLLRRARQRDAVARHHKQRLKRALGKLLHIRPDLGDDEFISRLRNADSRLSAQQLDRIDELLRKLGQNPDEGSLVHLVAAVDEVVGR